MFEFYLFRIKVYAPQQYPLFNGVQTSSEVLRQILTEKPSAELRKGYVWHIGNLTSVGDSGIYFALGRTTKSLIERYDEEAGNFVEEDFETSPYTHAFLDLTYQVLGIAKKTRLAPTPKGIAGQLEKLLNDSIHIGSYGGRVEISQINDPEDFVLQIREAYAVTRFSMDFGEPNPWDANKDFQQPMQRLLKESHGRKGNTSIAGDDLDRGTLEELTRATASTGNDAQAIIRTNARGRGTRKRLKGNPAVIQQEEIASVAEQQNLLQQIRSYYEKLRRHLQE